MPRSKPTESAREPEASGDLAAPPASRPQLRGEAPPRQTERAVSSESPLGERSPGAEVTPRRYEFKVLTDAAVVPEIRSWLLVHPTGFRVQYPPRLINSIYLDTLHLDRYEENLAGVAERKKIRLRWYGDDTRAVAFTFEVKCKRGRVGWKLVQPISRRFDLEETRWVDLFAAVRAELRDELRIYLDGGGTPVLINRYRREYYCTLDRELRVTLDFGQVYYDQKPYGSPNLRFPLPAHDDAVVEFKTPPHLGERLSGVIGKLPLRVTRCSKFVRGVETALGYVPFDV